uniref:Ribonuclease P family protein n=1 Tax=Solanum tuberosum TaxID=4113 RepID=M0ZYL0_SOLTU
MVDETMSEQQKKRTMEALERRFTQAKAEIHQQQHKNKKIGVTTKTLAENNIGLTSQRINCLHCSNQRHLPQLRHPKKISCKNMTANDILHDLLQHALLLELVVGLCRDSQRDLKDMSIKQHKKFGSFDFHQESHNYDIFKPMHDKWKDYVKKLVKNIRKNQLSQCLLNAALHGALILVVQCTIGGFIGVRGIMICETVETLGIITEDNKFQGYGMPKWSANLNHLACANDTIIFCSTHDYSLGKIMVVLQDYEKQSGQKVNKEELLLFAP